MPQQSYSDVLLIINANSTQSEYIGTYFATQRNIPDNNVVRIYTTVNETANDVQFADIRRQIETAMINRQLTSSINYIVTTKGMPLKIQRGNQYYNASVNSELELILSISSSMIGSYNRFFSPAFGVYSPYTASMWGNMRISTRLDGYTTSDVIAIIDKSAYAPPKIVSGAKWVMDRDPGWSASVDYLNINMTNAKTSLDAKGMNTYLESTFQYVITQSNVIAYNGWAAQDHNWAATGTTYARQQNSYLPGAIGETMVSYSARSFNWPMKYGQSAIADMIAEGITGVKGYVYEPYSSTIADVSIVFPMYADGNSLGDAFRAGSSYCSWQDLVIGDPKCRIINTLIRSGIPTINEYSQQSRHLVKLIGNYPNIITTSTVITYRVLSSTNINVKVYNNDNKLLTTIYDGTRAAGNYTVKFNSTGLSAGKYTVELRAGNTCYMYKNFIIK